MISARAHYATLAMMELARRVDDPSPLSAGEIIERHGIPGPFLTQILRFLRAAGWVQSLRGSHGGYRLSVDPSKITVLDIVEVFGGSHEPSGRGETHPTSDLDPLLQPVWDAATEAWRRSLAERRLSDLVEQSRRGDDVMFYI